MSTILGSTFARARVVAVTTLVLVLFAPFANTLLWPRGQIFGELIYGDNPSYYFFAHDFVAHAIRSGEFPLWNPYAMLGFPQLAEGQAAIFHPLSTLYYVFPIEIAMNWVIALSIVLAGVAFWSYLRALGLGPAASWCGAIVWAFGGRMPARIDAGHLNMLVGFLSWPLVLGAWERYRTTGRVYHLGVLSLAYAALIFTGYPQFTFIFSLFFLCYVTLQFIAASSKRQALADLKAVLWLGLFVVLGIGIAAAQLLPTLDFITRSSRSASSYEFSSSLSLPPESLLTVLTPNFFGHTPAAQDQYWGRSLYWESCLYFGILPIVASVVGAFAAPREKRTALVGCALLFLVVGFGRHTPIYELIYEYVPLAGLFRGPSKYSAVMFFCAAALTGYGTQAIFDGFRKRNTVESTSAGAGTTQLHGFYAALAVIGVLLLLVVGLFAYFVPGDTSLDSRLPAFMRWIQKQSDFAVRPLDLTDAGVVSHARSRLALGLGQAALFLLGAVVLLSAARNHAWRRLTLPLAIALLIADLGLSFTSRLSRFDVELTRLPSAFADVIERHAIPPRVHDLTTGVALAADGQVCQTFLNQGMSHGYTSLSGYTGSALERYKALVQDVHRGGPSTATEDVEWMRRLYRMMSVDYLIAIEVDLEPGTPIVARHLGRVLVPLNPPYARARLLRDAVATTDPQEALQYIHDAHQRPSARPILETNDPLPPPSPLRPTEYAQITSYANDRVELDVLAAQPRVLLLAEMYDQNWQATVNDSPTAVLPANYALRAVHVPAGHSRVVFEYVDQWFRRGAIISLASLLLTIVITAVSLATARRKQAPARPKSALTSKNAARTPTEYQSRELATIGIRETSLWRRWGIRAARKR